MNKAKGLLAEAGYPDGFEVEFLTYAGNALYEQIAIILKEQWAKIGVTLNILSLEPALARSKIADMDYEVVVSHWTNDINDPSQQCEYVCMHEVCNSYDTGWINMEVEALVQEGLRELDLEKRKQIYFKIQEIHHQEVPMMAIFHTPFPVAIKNEIEGFIQTPLGNYRFEELVMYVD